MYAYSNNTTMVKRNSTDTLFFLIVLNIFVNFQGLLYRMTRLGLGFQDDLKIGNSQGRVVALSCKMVGGGTDGSLDLCARVCLIDEHERILFESYVAPNIPITNYR